MKKMAVLFVLFIFTFNINGMQKCKKLARKLNPFHKKHKQNKSLTVSSNTTQPKSNTSAHKTIIKKKQHPSSSSRRPAQKPIHRKTTQSPARTKHHKNTHKSSSDETDTYALYATAAVVAPTCHDYGSSVVSSGYDCATSTIVDCSNSMFDACSSTFNDVSSIF